MIWLTLKQPVWQHGILSSKRVFSISWRKRLRLQDFRPKLCWQILQISGMHNGDEKAPNFAPAVGCCSRARNGFDLNSRLIIVVVRNMEAKRGLNCASVATRGHYSTMIQMRGLMLPSPHLALARHLCVGTTMRGTAGNSSVSLHVYMPRDEEQSTTRESTSELCLLGHSLPHWRLDSSTNSVP
jgi:hypothetical protein